MIAPYGIIALAIFISVVCVVRGLLASWRTAGCASGGCAGCSQKHGSACAEAEPLVQLRRSEGSAPYVSARASDEASRRSSPA
jgi:hypothetical protein